MALEIQATLPTGTDTRSSTVPTMMRGVHWTFIATGLCYFGVAATGFWAFGTAVPDNVLSGFAAGPHAWVLAVANMFVVVHVAAAYQVYANPLFMIIEADSTRRRGGLPLPAPLRVAVRTACVLGFTAVGVLVPFFGSLMGFIGAIAVTPTTFLLPALFWLLLKRPARWSADWLLNWSVVWVTGCIGVLGAIAAMSSIIGGWKTFKLLA